ncbi:MAG: hypothetical protein QXE64_00440 [Candidatus Pacearchaeota archaeon]
MIKEKFNELKKSQVFKRKALSNSLGHLFLVFCITDSSFQLEQIDFSFGKLDRRGKFNIKCFSLKEGKWHYKESIEEKHFLPLKLGKVKDAKALLPKLKELCDKSGKFIFILMNEDGKEIYSITCLSDFFIHKLKFDAKSLELLDKKQYSISELFIIKK